MRNLISECYKLKNSFILYFFIIKFIAVISISYVFLYLYPFMEFEEKRQFLLAIFNVLEPIFISIMCYLSIEQEENANNFQNILIFKNRYLLYYIKIFNLYFLTIFVNLMIWVILGVKDYKILLDFIIIGILQSISSLYLYLFHFFLNIFFNYSISIIISIFEGILVIFFTNISFGKLWIFFPSVYSFGITMVYLERNSFDFIYYGIILFISFLLITLLNLYSINKIKK